MPPASPPAPPPPDSGASAVRLGDALLEALGWDPARFTGSYSAVQGWRNAGWSEDELLAEVRRIAGRPGYRPPRSNPLGWLAKVLPQDAPPQGSAGGGGGEASAESGERLRWASRIEAWRKRGWWPVSAGPRPDEPGCQAPKDLLAKGEG